ncbi:uncharacterized protein LOC115183262 [Salmo trutta]|uniref:uncharacterized protein LOC115149567 n=1 Tax=Salmo trutta TaxID=8032 RepID=UPI0011312FE1|nr:uncharacterized protein LOC115149567 [Salmo trutta]XP_029600463.1 uncharacterized protein LOC115183262 [Salmo trutta]
MPDAATCERNFPELNHGTRLVVPGFHADGHDLPCQMKFNTRYVEGAGLADGEQMERLWSYLRRCGKVTKEMRPSHLIDLLTDALLHHGKTPEATGLSAIEGFPSNRSCNRGKKGNGRNCTVSSRKLKTMERKNSILHRWSPTSIGSSIKTHVKDYNLRRRGLSSQLLQALVYEDAVQVDSTDWSWRAGGAEDDGEVHLKLRLLVLFVKRSDRLRMMSSLPRCSTRMSRN